MTLNAVHRPGGVSHDLDRAEFAGGEKNKAGWQDLDFVVVACRHLKGSSDTPKDRIRCDTLKRKNASQPVTRIGETILGSGSNRADLTAEGQRKSLMSATYAQYGDVHLLRQQGK